jgi:hypothetical protein
MPEKIHFKLTAHAVTVMAEWQISLAWVERVLMRPERIEPDRIDPDLRHALGRIPERDDRILRVVYNKSTEPWRVVTAYFDWSMRGGYENAL